MNHYSFATPNGRTRHSVGTPDGVHVPMSTACLIVRTEEEGGSGYLLVRYSRDGAFAGDTWHQSIEDAEHQMDFEFYERTAWKPIPADVSDLDAFVGAVLKTGP